MWGRGCWKTSMMGRKPCHILHYQRHDMQAITWKLPTPLIHGPTRERWKSRISSKGHLVLITCLNGMQYSSGQHLTSVASLPDSKVEKFSYDVLVVLMSYLDCAVLITTNFVQYLRAAYTATRTFTEWQSRNEFNGQTPLYLYSTTPESGPNPSSSMS